MNVVGTIGKASSQAPLLLTPRDTARALAISERTLCALTQRGDIPVVRIGRSVRYDPRDLNEWLAKQEARDFPF